MRYFRISQNQDIPGSVSLREVNNIGGYHEARGGDLSKLDSAIVSLVDYIALDSCPDIHDRDIFMVKGAVKQTFDMFLPQIQYKHLVITERDGKRYEQYYIPLLDVLDKSEIQEAMIQDRPIFCFLKGSKEVWVVVSLEVIEAVLRRNPMGIRIDVITEEIRN